MRRLLVLLLLLAPVAQAKGVGPLETIAFLEPGERAEIVLDTGNELRLNYSSRLHPLQLEVRARGAAEPLYQEWTRSANVTLATLGQRVTVSWQNNGTADAGFFFKIEGDGVQYVESRGIRQLAPESWRTPAPDAFTVLFILLMGGLLRRR